MKPLTICCCRDLRARCFERSFRCWSAKRWREIRTYKRWSFHPCLSKTKVNEVHVNGSATTTITRKLILMYISCDWGLRPWNKGPQQRVPVGSNLSLARYANRHHSPIKQPHLHFSSFVKWFNLAGNSVTIRKKEKFHWKYATSNQISLELTLAS